MQAKAKRYIEEGGGCLYCGDDNISGTQVEIEENIAHQHMACVACGAEWIDYYTLDHIAVEDKAGDLQVYSVAGEVG